MAGAITETELAAPALKRLLREGRDDPEALWSRVAHDLEWFEPWDAVYEEGYLWFSGRADEVITIAGHRIGPTDIEVETEAE